MRSRASFKSHPIHPVLIPFPLAFLSGAFFFNLGGTLLDLPALSTTAAHLTAAGVVMALVAAVPGSIDYFATVPPRSTGKARARKHGLVNLGAVALFALSWLLRGSPESTPGAFVLLLQAAGLGLLGAGGWMGGTLVNRNQIGVDHRYAGAGKWKEERFSTRGGGSVVVAESGELQVDQLKLLHVDGRRIVLGRTEEGHVAFEDRCSHRGASLADGVMICGTVQCPWHGSQFDVRTGQRRAGPAEEGIETYQVEESGGEVRLRLPG